MKLATGSACSYFSSVNVPCLLHVGALSPASNGTVT